MMPGGQTGANWPNKDGVKDFQTMNSLYIFLYIHIYPIFYKLKVEFLPNWLIKMKEIFYIRNS